MTMTTLEQTIDRLHKATEEARAATREAHATLKDLRDERRAIAAALADAEEALDHRIQQWADNRLDAAVDWCTTYLHDQSANVTTVLQATMDRWVDQELQNHVAGIVVKLHGSGVKVAPHPARPTIRSK